MLGRFVSRNIRNSITWPRKTLTVFSGGCGDGVLVREGLEAGEKTRS